MLCTHCGAIAHRTSTVEEFGGFLLRHQLQCWQGHTTESVELPSSTVRELDLDKRANRHFKALQLVLSRHLSNQLKREQQERRRAHVIRLIDEGWKPAAIAHETGVHVTTVSNIKRQLRGAQTE